MAELCGVVECSGGLVVAVALPFMLDCCGVCDFSGGGFHPGCASTPWCTTELCFLRWSFANGLTELCTSPAEFCRQPMLYNGVVLHPGVNLYD